MNKLLWYVLGAVAAILLGIFFYLSYKYYRLKTLTPVTIGNNVITNELNTQNEKPINVKGTIFCIDENCAPGFRANDGKEYFLSIRNVEDPQVIETYLDNSSKLEINGTLNLVNILTIVGKEYPVLTINSYEEI